MNLRRVFETIDDHEAALVADLRRILREPSVNEDQAACAACAQQVADLITEAGLHARLLPSWHNPVVVGWSEQRTDRPTLLVTGHYDVVPPGPETEWRHPPFAAELDGRTIYARGACDPKGNIVAGVEAARMLLAATGDVPVNVKFLFEGDDEGPGEHLGKIGAFVNSHRELLGADAVLLLDAGFSRSGHSPVHLGTAGSLALELCVKTGVKPPAYIHTSLVSDAAFRLVWALASLKSPDERVAVEGFYEHVHPPSEGADEWMRDVPWDDDSELAFWGVERFVTGVRGIDAVRRLLYEPTCSIHGIEPGLGRANADSMVPNEARAWVNFHLVPDQDPDDVLRKVRAHLDEHGFGDVSIEVMRRFAPMTGSRESAIGRAVLKAARAIGVGCYLLPDSYEIGDKWCFLASRLGVEGALVGIGDPDRAAHMPNEHISVDYYLQGIKWIAAAYSEFAAAASGGDVSGSA